MVGCVVGASICSRATTTVTVLLHRRQYFFRLFIIYVPYLFVYFYISIMGTWSTIEEAFSFKMTRLTPR